MPTKSFHIAAYTFRADEVCPDCILGWARDVLRAHGWTENEIEGNEQLPMEYDPGFKAVRSERALTAAAKVLGVDVLNVYSFDSDYFPKVVFEDQIEPEPDYGRERRRDPHAPWSVIYQRALDNGARPRCGTCGEEL